MDSDKDSAISAEVSKNLDNLFGDEDEAGESSQKKQGTLEVDRRLDDFFGEEDKNPGKKKEKKAGAKKAKPEGGRAIDAENSSLKELKSIVLSLEWEITDQVMQRLDDEIVKLEKECKSDKIVVAFVQLLGSLGKYIRKKQADAHPDSISLVNSVYENLEKAMLDKGISDADKKKMLVAEVNKYKKLKEYIATAKTASKPKAEKPAERSALRVSEAEMAAESPSATTPMPPVSLTEFDESEESGISESSTGAAGAYQDVIAALERINITLKTEFKTLREELKLIRENLK